MITTLALTVLLGADPAVPLAVVVPFQDGTPAQATAAREAVMAELKAQGFEVVRSEDRKKGEKPRKGATVLVAGSLVPLMKNVRVNLTMSRVSNSEVIAFGNGVAGPDDPLATVSAEAARALARQGLAALQKK